MASIDKRAKSSGRAIARQWDAVRRAFDQFLMVPTGIILTFLLLAAGSYYLDRANIAWLAPFRTFLQSHVFGDVQATSDLLGTIAGSIITMTTLTITLLLIVVQQSAASLTTQVFDQFLRRPHNQIYFGIFIGLALYALVTLATVNTPFNPVFGATFTCLATAVTLYLLIVLIYTTIDQMRPEVIIEAIHDHILNAREHQLSIIRQTRRASQVAGSLAAPVIATQHGYVTRLNLAHLKAAIEHAGGNIEVVLEVAIGSYIAYGDLLAHVKADEAHIAAGVAEATHQAIHLELQRDIKVDAAYGIKQLEMIAWTSISSSKSNPSPGLQTIRTLRDLLARWATEENTADDVPLPIVYPDNVPLQLMDTLETLAVVSSESMQHQNFIEVVHTVSMMFDRLSVSQQQRAEDLIARILSALGDHVLTAGLDTALRDLVKTLKAAGRFETAASVMRAYEQLKSSVGKLNSRSTRVPTQ